MKLKLLTFTFIAMFMMSCTGNKKTDEQKEPEKSNTLVLYYSQTGTTKTVADELQKLLNADIDSIVAVDSYGYDYNATIDRWRKEREDSVKVAIKPLTKNINDYDTIFLGFPIWGGTFASPVATFLSDNSLEGKTIITFATFGSGGIENATKDMKTLQPNSNVVEGYGVRNVRITKAPIEIKRFLKERGYVKGDISSIPEYGEMLPVTEEDVKIFDNACGDYQFPLGTPISVAKRSYDGATDYCYDVVSKTPDGQESKSTIYVLVEPNQKPEFTRVVR